VETGLVSRPRAFVKVHSLPTRPSHPKVDSASKNLHVMLAIAEPEVFRLAQELLEPRCGTLSICPLVSQVQHRVVEQGVDIVVMDLDSSHDHASQVLRELSTDHPELPVIVLSRDDSRDAVREAMILGARDLVRTPIRAVELLEAFEQAAERRTRALRGRGSHGRSSVVHPTTRPGKAKGIWSFCSATSGVGRSTFLMSSAHELARRGYTVAVVDLDLFFGDLAFYYGFQTGWTSFADIFEGDDHLDLGTISRALVRHSSGVYVLAGPLDCTQASTIDRRLVAEVVVALQRCVDYVLVDFPAGISDVFLPVLDASKAVFLAADQDLSSLKNLTTYLHLMKSLDFPWELVHPVLVGLRSGSETPEEFNRIIGRFETRLATTLPESRRSAQEAILQGRSLAELQPEGDYIQSVRSLLDQLSGGATEVEEEARSSILGRLLGWSLGKARPGAVQQVGV
jgi:pilus assembly protein CpaE